MQSNTKSFKKFKKLPLLISILFLAFSCALFVFFYGKVKDNEKEADKAQMEWHTETLRRNEIRSLERSIREIEAERVEIETHFAESGNVVPFLDTIEKLARDAGATSQVVSVDLGKERPELLVSLQTEGSFESTYKFIKLLENSPYELDITSFDIEKSTGSGWSGSFTIRLRSFIQ